MVAKFIITLEDGTEIVSHDDDWKQLKVHAHALAPHNKKKWIKYKLVGSNGTTVEVDYKTGTFRINDNTVIHPADNEYENPLTNIPDEQNFPVTEAWQVLNGMPYFPVVGTRKYRGEQLNMDLYFVGWKKQITKKGIDRTVQKLAFVMPDGDVVLT